MIYAAAHNVDWTPVREQESMSYTSGNFTKTAFPMLDMMLQMQQIGLRAMTMYQPAMAAMLNSAKSMERTAERSMFSPMGSSVGANVRDAVEVHEHAQERVIPVGEEVLNVATRMVPGKTTRVKRIVVEQPVHQEITLHTETVVLEHRKPLHATSEGILTEVTVEMSNSNEIPVVSKSVRLVEEVLLRKEVTARVETIHDTIKRDTLEIEQPTQLPAVYNSVAKQEEKRREERRAAEIQEKKAAGLQPIGDNKGTDLKAGPQASDQKRT